MAENEGFNYQLLGECEYDDCGEPTIARGWWGEGSPMYLCKKHLDFILGPENEDALP